MRPLALLLLGGCVHAPLRPLADDATVSLPADHRPHDEAQTEWWHVHAELAALDTGEPVHVFAGFVLQRTQRDRVAGVPVGWAVGDLHVAYVHLVAENRSWVADRSSFPDAWTARFVGADLDYRHGDWRVAWDHGVAVLEVSAGPHELELVLEPTAPATLPGDAGRVALIESSPHQWVQLERMAVRGRWKQGRHTRWVEGTGFYKHQWGRIYDDELDGFEWISLNLPDERSLSVAWLLADGERGVAGSRAWVTGPDGVPTDLPPEAVTVTPLQWSRSRRSGTEWPVAWQVTGPELDLFVAAESANQELWVFPAALYAGPARATGTWLGQTVDVAAYVEGAGHRAPRLRFLFSSLPPKSR